MFFERVYVSIHFFGTAYSPNHWTASNILSVVEFIRIMKQKAILIFKLAPVK